MPNLGTKIKKTLVDGLLDFLSSANGSIVSLVSDINNTIGDFFYTTAKSLTNKLYDSLIDEQDVPERLAAMRRNWEDNAGWEGFIACCLMLITLPLAVMQSSITPYANSIQRSALKRHPSVLAPVDAQIMGYMRGVVTLEELQDRLAQMGFDTSQIETLLTIALIKPTAFEYNMYWLRGEMSDSEHITALRALGYSDRDIDVFKALSYYIPAPPDLIRMAVREVFTPEIAEKFGQFEQFPEAFAEHGAKQGLSREWCMNYWGAHWELPSILMGYEMLHRGVINDEELDMLMKAQDVMPFWRNKLKAISYNVYARVDVRRMYAVKVLNEDDVYRAYLDMGYDADHAQHLTDFTIKSQKSEDKELAKGEIIKGYNERILNYEEVGYALATLGYSEDEISYLLALEDAKVAEQEQKDRIALFSTKVQAKQISIADFRAELGKMNLPATQLDLLVAKEELRATVKATLPDKTDIVRWYQKGTMNAEDAEEAFDALGFDPKYIDLFLTEEAKNPTVAMTIRWFNKGLIDQKQTEKYLDGLGYGKAERDLLISEATAQEEVLARLPSIASVKKWLTSGSIPEKDARDYLAYMGYAEREISLFINEWAPVEV